MLVDWFTVVAQVVNFLILVWLLKRFLYKPILRAIDEREKRITTELADAAMKQAEAKQERDEFHRQNEGFVRERAALMSQAIEEAQIERQRLFEEARQAADAMNAKRQETLRNEAHTLNHAIGQRTQQEVLAIARKALADLAGTSLEERLIAVFIRRLQEMDEEAKADLAEALRSATRPGHVRSAFELPPEQRVAIQKALNDTFPGHIHVEFETAPDLIGGIELSTDGHKVGWSIAEYIVSLEQGLNELLKTQNTTDVKLKSLSGGYRPGSTGP